MTSSRAIVTAVPFRFPLRAIRWGRTAHTFYSSTGKSIIFVLISYKFQLIPQTTNFRNYVDYDTLLNRILVTGSDKIYWKCDKKLQFLLKEVAKYPLFTFLIIWKRFFLIFVLFFSRFDLFRFDFFSLNFFRFDFLSIWFLFLVLKCLRLNFSPFTFFFICELNLNQKIKLKKSNRKMMTALGPVKRLQLNV